MTRRVQESINKSGINYYVATVRTNSKRKAVIIIKKLRQRSDQRQRLLSLWQTPHCTSTATNLSHATTHTHWDQLATPYISQTLKHPVSPHITHWDHHVTLHISQAQTLSCHNPRYTSTKIISVTSHIAHALRQPCHTQHSTSTETSLSHSTLHKYRNHPAIPHIA